MHFTTSVLRQLQRSDKYGVSVEEGHQKIVPIAANALAALCGNAYDANEWARRMKAAFEQSDVNAILEYAANPPEDADSEVSVAVAGRDPPFAVYMLPRRVLQQIDRNAVHLRGSLPENLEILLANAIGMNLIEKDTYDRVPEIKLVCGLAYATTLAAQFNLTNDCVGGAFFGARLDAANVIWQPDIMYLLYRPGSDYIVPETFDRVLCQVRNDVSLAISLREGRIMAATSKINTPDTRAWMDGWISGLQSDAFEHPQYFVFVPTSRGTTVIAPNNGRSFKLENEGGHSMTDQLAELLDTIPPQPFAACVLGADL